MHSHWHATSDIKHRTFVNEEIQNMLSLVTEADLGLFKLAVMIKVFFNNLQHKIKIRPFICVKQIKFSLFSNIWNKHFKT